MLQARRYSATTIIQYLSRSRCFCRWMIKNNVPFDQADDQVIGRYLKSLGTPGVRKKAKGACRTLLRHLHEINAIKLISVDHNPDEAEQWLIRYREYLERVHGLAKGTRAQYVFFATRFLNGKCKDHLVDWSLVTADTIVQYVLLEVAHRKGFGPQHVATAIRSFLRFLASNSLAPAGLDAAIPTIRRWSQASLPQHLSQQELDRLIASSSADDTACILAHSIQQDTLRADAPANARSRTGFAFIFGKRSPNNDIPRTVSEMQGATPPPYGFFHYRNSESLVGKCRDWASFVWRASLKAHACNTYGKPWC
jgi:site-specific recombinase XerD